MLKWLIKKVNNRKGFTLIELVVVIAILGVLAAIAIPRLSGARANAAESADAASIRTIQSAIGLAEANDDIDLSSETAPTAATIKTAIVPKYLAEVPKAQMGIGWKFTISAAKPWSIDIKAVSANPDAGWTN